MRFPWLGAVAGSFVLLSMTQCSATERGFADPPPDAGVTDDEARGSEPGDFGGVDGGDAVTTCSSDLRQVLDGSGKVLATCPDDQGCAAGKCVPACEAAHVNKSTVGCDYYVAPPDVLEAGRGGCFAAFVVNTWGTPVKIAVERDGQALDVAGMARIPSGSGQSITYTPLVNDEIPPGEVAIVFLSRYGTSVTSCPAGVTPGFTSTLASVSGTGRGEAFHLTTTAPVAAYDIYPYGGGSSAVTSATLLIPTSAWDVNYLGVNAFRKSQLVPYAQPFLQIVAQEDGTQVTLLPSAAIAGGAGVDAAPAQQSVSYTLDRGQLLQFTQNEELSGSAIEANKPIGVFGGATCLSIDVDMFACDSAHQQLPPVRALGSRYAAVRYRNRHDGVEESTPWRLVGAVDGTTLTYEPSIPDGAPTSLAFGQVAEFWTSSPFVVKSQDADHPFYMSGHMTGAEMVAGSGGGYRGDPEFVNVIPAEQYLSSYVFFTDPTYPETNLVVVRRKEGGSFSDVTLDCAGALSGWEPLGSSGDLEFTRVDLVRGNFEKQGTCDNGRHEMKSDAPFGLTVWGWGSPATEAFHSEAVSYAYPAGYSVKPVNKVVVPTEPK